jgi:tRNA (mo5U34)-methyltransferase
MTSEPTREPSEGLREELDGPGWMFDWSIAPGVRTELLGPELSSIHQTRLEMMEDAVRSALAAAGPGARALDLACCEGWFSHRLLEWGAESVVGVDIREQNVRRAILMRDHYGIPADTLELLHADVLELDPTALGSFDVVLVLGLVYHMERPIDALRTARQMTRSLCVVESQLTRNDRPTVWGASPQQYVLSKSSFAMHVEPNASYDQLASIPGVASLIPNRAALEEMARVAGFTETEFAQPRPRHNRQYLVGDRALLLAR